MTDILIQPSADDDDNLTNGVVIDDATLPISAQSASALGLTLGTVYKARVLGDVETFSVTNVPAAMSAPTVTATSATEISVDRAAAPSDGGSAILSYDLRWEVDGSGSWTTVTGIADPQSVTGLTASTLYNVQTRAVNANGAGAWSASGSATTDVAAVGFTDSFVTGWTNGDAVTSSANYDNFEPALTDWDRVMKVDTAAGQAYVDGGTFGGQSVRYVGATVGANQYSEVLVDQRSDASANNWFLHLYLRVDATGQNYYHAQMTGTGGSGGALGLFIKKRVGGTETTLGAEITGLTMSNGDRFRFSVSGTSLTVERHNGTSWATVGTRTDSDVSSGQPGFGLRRGSTGTNILAGEFKCGEL